MAGWLGGQFLVDGCVKNSSYNSLWNTMWVCLKLAVRAGRWVGGLVGDWMVGLR